MLSKTFFHTLKTQLMKLYSADVFMPVLASLTATPKGIYFTQQFETQVNTNSFISVQAISTLTTRFHQRNSAGRLSAFPEDKKERTKRDFVVWSSPGQGAGDAPAAPQGRPGRRDTRGERSARPGGGAPGCPGGCPAGRGRAG